MYNNNTYIEDTNLEMHTFNSRFLLHEKNKINNDLSNCNNKLNPTEKLLIRVQRKVNTYLPFP